MSLYLVVTLITAIVTTANAIPDFVPAKFVLANSAEVGVPRSWLAMLGTLKLAGGVGLIVGVLGLPVIGIAAATGLVAFFIGAVLTHIRAGVLHNITFPAGFLLLAVASLTLAI